MRGTRSERTMRWSLFVGSKSTKASTTVCSGIALAPYASEQAAATARAATATTQAASPGPRLESAARRASRGAATAIDIVSARPPRPLLVDDCSANLTADGKSNSKESSWAPPVLRMADDGLLAAQVRARCVRLRRPRRRPPRAVGRHPQLPVAQPSAGDAQGRRRRSSTTPRPTHPGRPGSARSSRRPSRTRRSSTRLRSTTTRRPSPTTRAGTSSPSHR